MGKALSGELLSTQTDLVVFSSAMEAVGGESHKVLFYLHMAIAV